MYFYIPRYSNSERQTSTDVEGATNNGSVWASHKAVVATTTNPEYISSTRLTANIVREQSTPVFKEDDKTSVPVHEPFRLTQSPSGQTSGAIDLNLSPSFSSSLEQSSIKTPWITESQETTPLISQYLESVVLPEHTSHRFRSGAHSQTETLSIKADHAKREVLIANPFVNLDSGSIETQENTGEPKSPELSQLGSPSTIQFDSTLQFDSSSQNKSSFVLGLGGKVYTPNLSFTKREQPQPTSQHQQPSFTGSYSSEDKSNVAYESFNQIGTTFDDNSNLTLEGKERNAFLTETYQTRIVPSVEVAFTPSLKALTTSEFHFLVDDFDKTSLSQHLLEYDQPSSELLPSVATSSHLNQRVSTDIGESSSGFFDLDSYKAISQQPSHVPVVDEGHNTVFPSPVSGLISDLRNDEGRGSNFDISHHLSYIASDLSLPPTLLTSTSLEVSYRSYYAVPTPVLDINASLSPSETTISENISSSRIAENISSSRIAENVASYGDRDKINTTSIIRSNLLPSFHESLESIITPQDDSGGDISSLSLIPLTNHEGWETPISQASVQTDVVIPSIISNQHVTPTTLTSDHPFQQVGHAKKYKSSLTVVADWPYSYPFESAFVSSPYLDSSVVYYGSGVASPFPSHSIGSSTKQGSSPRFALLNNDQFSTAVTTIPAANSEDSLAYSAALASSVVGISPSPRPETNYKRPLFSSDFGWNSQEVTMQSSVSTVDLHLPGASLPVINHDPAPSNTTAVELLQSLGPSSAVPKSPSLDSPQVANRAEVLASAQLQTSLPSQPSILSSSLSPIPPTSALIPSPVVQNSPILSSLQDTFAASPSVEDSAQLALDAQKSPLVPSKTQTVPKTSLDRMYSDIQPTAVTNDTPLLSTTVSTTPATALVTAAPTTLPPFATGRSNSTGGKFFQSFFIAVLPAYMPPLV